MTVGFGDNQEKSGKNKARGKSPRPLGWWASMKDATVTIDGRFIMKNGNLLV